MERAVGLDVGNSKCVVAVSCDGVVDALLNDESRRETPSVVHFAAKHRLFGTAAASAAAPHPASTVSQLKRLFRLGFEEEDRRRERLLLLPYETAHERRLSVKVRYLGEDRAFAPAEMLAMLLAQLKRSALHADDRSRPRCVIGVPSYYTDEQKGAFGDAAVIAGWSPIGLLHEGVAAALEYASGRSDDDARYVVAFVDVGHSDTQITVVRFHGREMTVLAEACDPDLGGRDFDDVLFQHFMGVFEQQYRVEISSNAKARVRLWTTCEKAKRVLSANKEAEVSIDYLMEGVESAYGTITRDKFDELSGGLLLRIEFVFRKALEGADVGGSHGIDSVELVGSGSRIPAISTMLTKLFKRGLSRTLNGSECVARGCALLCEKLTALPQDFNTETLIESLGKAFSLYSSSKADDDYLSKSASLEKELRNQDLSHERAKDKRNELESYVYEMRKQINARSTTKDDKKRISKRLNEVEKWLYGEGDDESEQAYVDKLEDLKLFIDGPRVQDTVDIQSQKSPRYSRENSSIDTKTEESQPKKKPKSGGVPSELGIDVENNSKPSEGQSSSTSMRPTNPSKRTSNEIESMSHAHRNEKNWRDESKEDRQQRDPSDSMPREKTNFDTRVTKPSYLEYDDLNNSDKNKTEDTPQKHPSEGRKKKQRVSSTGKKPKQNSSNFLKKLYHRTNSGTPMAEPSYPEHGGPNYNDSNKTEDALPSHTGSSTGKKPKHSSSNSFSNPLKKLSGCVSCFRGKHGSGQAGYSHVNSSDPPSRVKEPTPSSS